MRPSLLLASWAAVAQAAAVSSPVQTRADGDDDVLALITKRRIADLSQFPNPPAFAKISTWLESQKEDGTWSDVNYLSGCEAREFYLGYPITINCLYLMAINIDHEPSLDIVHCAAADQQ